MLFRPARPCTIYTHPCALNVTATQSHTPVKVIQKGWRLKHAGVT
jgi:hypothetical protein